MPEVLNEYLLFQSFGRHIEQLGLPVDTVVVDDFLLYAVES